MILTREQVKKVLLAEHKVINAIRDEGMTPDDFSVKDYVDMICEAIENPTEFRRKDRDFRFR